MELGEFWEINVRNLPMIFYPNSSLKRVPKTDFFVYDCSHVAFVSKNAGEAWVFDSLGRKNSRYASLRSFFAGLDIKMRYVNKLNFQRPMTSDTCAIYAVLFSLKIIRPMSDWKLKNCIKPILKRIKHQTSKSFGSTNIISRKSDVEKILSSSCALTLLAAGSRMAPIRTTS